jgi:uncharacterized membrane protein YGL010W
MKTLTDHLSQYGSYHRDRRNIATHFIGIPMIVVAVAVLLSRPAMQVSGVWLAPATLVTALLVLFYLVLDLRLGLTMAVLTGLSLWVGTLLATGSTLVWLASGIGLFVVGWVFQFVGHYYEGKKPAFVDDISGLAIGPLFVVAEVAFTLGLRKSLREAIEARIGPTHIRQIDPVTAAK